MVAAMGTAIVAAGAGGAAMAQAADMGSDIFTQAYSRSQENEADRLGIRYLSRAGYDPAAMANFLGALEVYQNLQKRLDGDADATADFFDTHPGTTDRIAQAKMEAAKYPEKPDASDRDRYLATIDGIAYGDSDRQGFARGNVFWHPQMGFTFTVPEGFTIENQSSQVVVKGQDAIVILDTVAIGWPKGPASYLRDKWMAGEKLDGVQDTVVSGMKAATASFPGHVGGRPVTIMIAAIQWAPDMIFRFQAALPQGSSTKLAVELQQMINSLRRITDSEKRSIRPWHIHVVVAQAGDTVASLSSPMPFGKMNEDRFRVLNGLKGGEGVAVGQKYKLVAAD
jgi:predicted Zn-dependent protease